MLFLTARDCVEDKVTGLTVGGDDYVTKPFSLAEIVARVRAVLRRTQTTSPQDEQLRFADVVLDEETHEVWRAGTPLRLTATEFNLLRYFMLNPRRVLSKSQILDQVWHYDFGGDANVVETYVSYVRKKIDRLGPPLLHTIRLVGYTLRETEPGHLNVAAGAAPDRRRRRRTHRPGGGRPRHLLVVCGRSSTTGSTSRSTTPTTSSSRPCTPTATSAR